MIRLGPAGSGGLGNLRGIETVSKKKLQAMEIEFTYGVNMSDDVAKKIGLLAKELDISLSVHAPYYINLASKEKAKVSASKKRILDSSKKAYYLNARYVVFHAGFYQGQSKEETYETIKHEIEDLMRIIRKNKWNVELAPETTGKPSQFGDLDELLRLRADTGCHLCVDFAHILARTGRIDYDSIFKKLEGLKHIHAHFSGIEYTKKGERRHTITKPKDIRTLLQHITKRGLDITIINESPSPLSDSLKTQNSLQ